MAAVARIPATADQSATTAAPSQARTFVAIRPAFRPLLPKPAAPTNGVTASDAAPEPTVVLKSQQARAAAGPKVIKKRRSDAGVMPSTVAPASLISKRRKSPSVDKSAGRVRRIRLNSASPSSSGGNSPTDLDDGSDNYDVAGEVSEPIGDVAASVMAKSVSPVETTLGGYSPESMSPLEVNPLVLSDSPVSMNFELKVSDIMLTSGAGSEPTADPPLQGLGEDLWPEISVKALDGLDEAPLAMAPLDLAVDGYFAGSTGEEPSNIDPMDFFGPAMDIF